MNDVGRKVMLGYLQCWGQSAEERIAVLNMAAKEAGLDAEWRQGPNGESAGWRGPDAERAREFKRRLDHDIWTGEFNSECRAVEALVAEFKNRKEN